MRFIYAVILLLTFLGCKKSSDFDMEYEYYPIVPGNFIIYKVQQIHVDVNSSDPYDTLNYYVKAKIGDTVHDNEGRIARRYERYYGNSASGPWNIHDVWTTLINGNKAELVEENNRTIKMVFKPTSDKEWNCNTYNTLETLNCYYDEIDNAFSINGMDFSNAVTVEQENELNFIEYKRKYERYAKGVGMIYKCYIDFVITGNNPNNVKKGDKLIMEAVSYGQE